MASSRRLDDWLDSYMLYTSRTEPPKIYNLWTGISVIASCLERKCYIDIGDIRRYPNMYIVLVGPPGRCRKGTAMGVGLNMLRSESISVHLAAEAITREALIQELRSSIEEETVGQDVHASLTIYSPELSVFLGYNNTQLMSDLQDWWDCRDKWTYRTKSQGTDEIVNVWVNIVGATTPEVISEMMPSIAVGGGLTSRIIFVFAKNKEQSVAIPGLFEGRDELYKKLLMDLQSIRLMQGEFYPTKEFLTLFEEWYIESDKKPVFDDVKLSGYVERRATHLIKLCVILSASRGNDKVVDVQDFKRAVLMLDEVEKRMPHTFKSFGESDINNLMTQVATTIATYSRVPFSVLMRKFFADADRDKLMRVIMSLQASRLCTIHRNEDHDELYIEYVDSDENMDFI